LNTVIISRYPYEQHY